MTDDSTVNSQIVDAVSSVVTLSTGQAASQALGMLDAVLLETLGMAMYNAVNRQQNANMVTSAALTAACAKMLQTPFPIKPPAPPPGPPPMVAPLPGPPPSPLAPAVVVAMATEEGKTAIASLKAQASGSSGDAASAQNGLQALHALTADPSPPASSTEAAPTPTSAPTPAPASAPASAPTADPSAAHSA